jgi:hypothetical protein
LRISQRLLSILVPWLMLRILLSLIVLGASSARPNTSLEKTVNVWPVSSPPEAWIKRVLLEPWRRWDSEYFEYIAERGYRRDDGTLQFHPLYPLLGRSASFLFAGNVTAGLLAVSSVSCILFLLVFVRLAEFNLPQDDSQRAAGLLLHGPMAFILFAPYSEGLFLLFTALTLLMARRGSWWMAAVAGGLATLTRQQGIFLVLPLVWELWEWCQYDISKVVRRWRSVTSLLLIPASLLGWLAYRGLTFGDIVLDAHNPRTWVYGLLISKDATQVVAEQRFDLPWNALADALRSLQTSTVFDLVLGGMFVGMFVAGGRALWRMRKSYFLYAGVILLVSFSYNTGAFLPYMGLPRHCLLAFPLFLPMATWARGRLETLVLVGGFLGMAVLAFSYAAKIFWVP